MTHQYMELKIKELEKRIQALEQDTVPFDFELYQAGLMDMPKGMIEVLEDIKAEISKYKDDKVIHAERNEMIDIVLDIINKHIGGKE